MHFGNCFGHIMDKWLFQSHFELHVERSNNIDDIQDKNPSVEHGDSSGGVAAGLHVAGLPIPGGVCCHPQTDCHLQTVSCLIQPMSLHSRIL